MGELTKQERWQRIYRQYSQKSYGVRTVNIEMKIGEEYLLNGCLAWTCKLAATGIAEAQREEKRMDDLISRQQAIGEAERWLYDGDDNRTIGEMLRDLPSVQPERKAVFNRDIAIEAICDEVMLWFDISATKAYEIADTAVKRIEVRMEKTERGERDE